MTPLRALLVLVGLAAIVALLAQLPDAVFAATQSVLLVVAGALFLLAAAAVVLAPARRLEARLFAGHAPDEQGIFAVAPPERIRALTRTIVVAMVCALAAVAPIALR